MGIEGEGKGMGWEGREGKGRGKEEVGMERKGEGMTQYTRSAGIEEVVGLYEEHSDHLPL